MRQPPTDQRLRHMLWGSFAAHLLGFALMLGWAQLSARQRPAPQHVLVTKLVRLGTPRPKALLPQKEPPPEPAQPVAPPTKASPTPPPPPAAAAVEKAAAIAPLNTGPTAKERASATSRVNSALAKLKRNVDGQADGARDGEADVAQAGDRWASEVRACIAKNYTIEGTDPRRAAGRSAVVILRVQNTGKIVDHKIRTSSGLAAFDQAVSRAVMRCGQVSPPPMAMRRQLQRDGIEIEFRP